MDVHARRVQQLPVDRLDLGDHLPLDIDDIGAGLPAQGHEQVGRAIEGGIGALLEMIQANSGHIGQADHRVSPARQYQLLELSDILEAPHGAHQVLPLAGVYLPGGAIAIAAADGFAHIRQRQPPLRQARGIDQDLYLPLGTAEDVDLRNPRHTGQAGFDVVIDKIQGHIHVQLARVTRQRQHAVKHKEVGGEGVGENARFVDIFRVGGHLAEGVVDPDQHVGYIGAKGEFQLYLGHAAASRGRDPRQVGQVAQVILLLHQYFLFHVLWRGARPDRAHPYGAHIQVGDHLHRDTQGGNDAQQADYQHRDGYQGAAADYPFKHRSRRPPGGRLYSPAAHPVAPRCPSPPPWHRR